MRASILCATDGKIIGQVAWGQKDELVIMGVLVVVGGIGDEIIPVALITKGYEQTIAAIIINPFTGVVGENGELGRGCARYRFCIGARAAEAVIGATAWDLRGGKRVAQNRIA